MEEDFISRLQGELQDAIDGADPLAGIVRTHLILEQALNEHLESLLPHPEAISSGNLRFFQKAHVLRSLNLLTENGLDILVALNNLRNRFAHKLGYELSDDDVNRLGELCPELHAHLRGNGADAVTAFGQIFSRLLGKIAGEFLGGRASVGLEPDIQVTGS